MLISVAGPAMALIFRRAALCCVRGAMPTVLGLEAGIYPWALAAAAGFAALVAASETAFLVLPLSTSPMDAFIHPIRDWLRPSGVLSLR